MNEYRGILAFVSVIAGVVLLIAAARYSFTKTRSPLSRRSALTSLLYGALFVATGVVLWSRKDIPAPVTQQPPRSQIQRSSPVQPAPSEVDTVLATSHEVFADTLADISAGRSAPAEVQVWQSEETVTPDPAAERSLVAQSPEVAIYLAVDRALYAIKAFFERYASPAPQQTWQRMTGSQAPLDAEELHFPVIAFGEGGSEISAESIPALKALAADLILHSEVSIEIQTRVDSLGPEAYNFMLTQARASAVRDLLVVEGVPAERLIAKGFGTQPLPIGTDTPIAFVVRR